MYIYSVCITYIYTYLYIYITSKKLSIKRGFPFNEEQNNVIYTLPEDCAIMKLRFA